MSLRSEYYIRHECKLYFLIINWHNNRHNILDKVVLIKCIKLSTWRPLWTIYTKMHLMTWRYKMSRFWLLFAKQRQKLQVAKHQQLDKKKKKNSFYTTKCTISNIIHVWRTSQPSVSDIKNSQLFTWLH